MQKRFTRMFVLLLGCVLFIVPIPSASQPQAALQLLRFRNSLPESSRSLLQWNQTTSPSAHCSWTGVNCSATGFRIETLVLVKFGLSGILEDSFPYLCELPDLITLDLSSNNFSGNVPAVLGNCSQLVEVFLYNTSLSGSIPSGIFKPGLLQRLDLGGNKLTGTIPPEVGLCKRLISLRLDNNLLEGEIPSELFSIPTLSVVYLHLNNLIGTLPELPSKCLLSELQVSQNSFHGPLPPSISNCHDLYFLDASKNKLGGVIQQDIFEGLKQLREVFLGGNRFEGQIPMSLWSLKNLTELALEGNRFNGSIPENIKQCENLTYLDLSLNALTGGISDSVSYLRNLKYLYLYNTTLGGSLPPGIGNCTSLVHFVIRHNQIGGTFPPEICGLRSLKILNLNYNQIEGPIPRCIDSLISLQLFSIFNNKMTGGIPSGISKLTNLTGLSLADNNLTGVVPSDLGKNNVPGLDFLDLTGNQFTGEIPSTLCPGNRLSRLVLGDNNFTGSFPAEYIKCKSLYRLSLHNNRLQGSIPNDMGISSSIAHFDIRGNLFEGTIPRVLGSWSNLSLIDLSENKFSGSIPQEFGDLQNLVRLRIYSNRLTGEIPRQLSRCPIIGELDLSKNELAGGVPSELLSSSTLTIVRLQENKLTGVIPNSFVSSQKLQELQLGNNLLEGLFPCSLSRVENFNHLNLSANKFSGEIPRCISNLDMLEVLDISSNKFSGEIPSEANNMIALTFLNISYNQLSGHIPAVWAKALEAHLGTFLGNQRLCLISTETSNCVSHKKAHPGVLAGIVTGSLFLTACLLAAIYILVIRVWQRTPSSPMQALLYHRSSNEELPEDLSFLDILRGTEGWSDKHVIGRGKHGTEGTLYNLLHKRRPRVALDWEQRCRIALGIAQGLSYLHHDCVPPIIHRDIKSDNILLDTEFEPKIGDFGAAKLDSDDEKETVSAIIGTLGYIAPENAYSTRLTDKCDVYSYGVTLLELLCRKLPVDPSFDEGLDIVSWVRTTAHDYEDRFNFLDEEIMYWDSEDQQEALVMVDLALQCTEMHPDSRPSMRDVVSYLLKFQQKIEVIARNHSTVDTQN